ncbi:MaoC/PaaZ C-terminal domain-containing protein [Bradyrhizobium sp. LHD-71]|uniref:MaoC family dehydratase n=1 Tax=Bradyrhizobium sp. LHD-71 TaxID=3072141 RepID=UPI00280CDDB3|nr:MaoC/PaaZ C-terminal domain-containing protein [Bradyrhizobium sp. LHD-71]MDQ8728212.1 MaoC/PaaZ C-terminal domain-containing protein [Bradyrhizobium sp. LHD-71]
MPVTYEKLMSLKLDGATFEYSERDSMLYALSIGMGRDPLNQDELAYVFEKGGIKTVPTQACVVARPNLLLDVGLDRTKVLHGEQRLTLHRPLPPSARLVASARIAEAYDKGPGKGAIIYVESVIKEVGKDTPLITLVNTTFARGDGGFGGPNGAGRTPHEVPSRAADLKGVTETRADQALLYRLNGDRNPLHADPALAERAGFKAPILHGLCSYAIACREVLKHVCKYDHTRIREFGVRFTSPVYPGETIETDIWVDGNIVSFRCRVPARNVTVLNNGRCLLNA